MTPPLRRRRSRDRRNRAARTAQWRRRPFRQYERPWRDLVWYEPPISKAVRDLTNAVHAIVRGERHGRAAARRALVQLSRATGDFAEKRKRLRGKQREATLAESGCWHVSVANMLDQLLPRPRSHRFTPRRLLATLQSEGIGTLTGYVENAPLDPISAITRGAVQLERYLDLGKRGVAVDHPVVQELLLHGCMPERRAIVNVEGHDHFGSRSHFVLVVSPRQGDFYIVDPGYQSRVSLRASYRRVFQIAVYRRVRRP